MSLYSKALRHINMDRVKELREENIKKQKLAEKKLQEEIIRAELKKIEAEEAKYINWRRELEEGMTTDSLGMINLEPNINDLTAADDKNSDAAPAPFPQDGSLSNNTWTMNSTPPEGSAAVVISLSVDLSRSDTISTQVHFDNAAIDPAHGMDVVLDGPVGSGLQQVFPLSVPGSGTGSANPQITINPKLRIKGVTLSYSAIGAINFEGNRVIGTNAIRISSTVPFRSNPMNLFVSLDDPESLPFHRGGLGGSEERKAKLKDMLEAGNEWMIRNGLDPSRTSPGDIQIAAGGVPRGTGGKSAGDPENIQWPRDRPGGAQPGPGYRPPKA